MDESNRRFGIADALLLIAGIAAGMAAVRAVSPNLNPKEVWEAFVDPPEGWSLGHVYAVGVELDILVIIPFFAAFTPACLALHLVPPRPRWRRLRRRPGFVACVMATAVAAAIALLFLAINASAWYDGGHSEVREGARIVMGIVAGSGILGGWTAMRLCGVWRPDAGWIDRLGRLLGFAWIACGTIGAGCILLL